MGFLSKMFGGDPVQDMDRAEKFLADDHRVRALELAEKVRRKAPAEHAERAEELYHRCRRAVMDQALERSAEAEAAGDLHDAADWIRAALERAEDTARRGELEGHLSSLLARIEAEEEAAAARTDLFAGPGGGTTEGDDEVPEAGHAWDYESYYFTLVDTLSPEMAERYEGRPEAFQRALVDLQEGNFDTAKAALDDLAAAHPDDAVVRFER